MEETSKVLISPDVIKDIVIETIKNIEGVHGVYKKNGINYTEITKMFTGNKSDNNMLEVEVGNDECVIDLSLVLIYGYNIRKITAEVSKVIRKNVKDITDYSVKELNLKVEKLVNLAEPKVENIEEVEEK